MTMNRAVAALTVAFLMGMSLDAASAQQTFGYGMDVVPMSTFHYAEWRQYGVDPIPGASSEHREIRTGYGHDPVPNTVGPHHVTSDHVLINEVIQHLTGAVEHEPPAKAQEAGPQPAAKPAPCCRCRCRCR